MTKPRKRERQQAPLLIQLTHYDTLFPHSDTHSHLRSPPHRGLKHPANLPTHGADRKLSLPMSCNQVTQTEELLF